MPDGGLVETIYGKSSKCEIYKEIGFWSTKFHVYPVVSIK